MIKYAFHIVLISFLFLANCTDGFIPLKGKVLDEQTKEPVPNRKIIIEALKGADRKFISSNIGEFFTDSSGNFTYQLKKIKNMNLFDFCVVGDSDYASSNNKFGISDLKRDGEFLIFYASKLTDLRIIINRTSKIPSYDTLYVSWQSNGIGEESLYPFKVENHNLNTNNRLRWIGGEVKSTIKAKVFADKKTIVYWKLFRNGRCKEFTDTLYCKVDAENSVSFKY